jgi:hypothetical protein
MTNSCDVVIVNYLLHLINFVIFDSVVEVNKGILTLIQFNIAVWVKREVVVDGFIKVAKALGPEVIYELGSKQD